jgi:hypothetical protein
MVLFHRICCQSVDYDFVLHLVTGHNHALCFSVVTSLLTSNIVVSPFMLFLSSSNVVTSSA